MPFTQPTWDKELWEFWISYAILIRLENDWQKRHHLILETFTPRHFRIVLIHPIEIIQPYDLIRRLEGFK